MKIAQAVSGDKSNTSPTEGSKSLVAMAQELEQFVAVAAQQGMSLYDAEKSCLATVLKMGRRAVEVLLQLQGDGDLGPTVQTAEGKTLQRSSEPVDRPLRTIFGEHVVRAYVYRPGPKKKIALRPIDARLGLSDRKGSYLWEEFSQYFCVEQAFGQAAAALEMVLGQQLAVDTLERINQRVGEQAEAFLAALPAVPPEEEGELLVVSADAKGVPLIREGVPAAPAHGPKPSRPGDRRMATLACVYSVDRYERSAEDVVAALFRDERPADQKQTPRPRPCHKRMTACFPTVADEGTADALPIRGDVRAWTWAAEEIEARRREGQTLIRLCDGQVSLWNSSDVCLGLDEDSAADEEPAAAEVAAMLTDSAAGPAAPAPPGTNVVDILDLLHVCSYAWLAARAFGGQNAAVERFVRQWMLRILQGRAADVIKGLRSMASRRKLRGEKLKDVHKTCNYFQNNLHRMRYDEYLAHGYPIASGVIEGACRHLVKDRMERSGMRWKEENAGAMLFVRALKVTELWDDFQQHRQAEEQTRLHPHRQLLENYIPADTLAA